MRAASVSVVALLLVSACAGDRAVDPVPQIVGRLTIEAGLHPLVGETTVWSATVLDETGGVRNAPIEWSVADVRLASIVSVETANGVSRAQVRGVTPGETRITARSGELEASEPLTVARGILRGRVVDAISGEGIRATLNFSETPWGYEAVAGSDATGAYTSPPLVRSPVTFEVYTGQFVRTTYHLADVREGQRTALETIPLVPDGLAPGTIAGQVRNAGNNSPISGATVLLKPGMNSAEQTVRQTITAADGSFSLGSVAAGVYTIRVEKAGFTARSRTGVSAGHASPASQDVVLSPGG